MKISNIEKFREELFKNLKSIYFSDCDIHVLAATKFEESDENKMQITHLENPLQIKKSHFDHDTWNEIVDAQYYITVSEITGEIDFWETKKGIKSFKWLTGIDPDDVQNKTVMMMEVVKNIMEIIND